MLLAIVACTENNVIGRDNQMPWHLPADLQHFKRVTLGKPVIMGRKTHESIGRPLPKRTNYILTRQADWRADGCEVIHSIEDIRKLAAQQDVFLIGGAQLYHELIDEVQALYLTRIHTELAGDAFFPTLQPDAWQLVSREAHEADERHAYAYSFEHWIRS